MAGCRKHFGLRARPARMPAGRLVFALVVHRAPDRRARPHAPMPSRVVFASTLRRLRSLQSSAASGCVLSEVRLSCHIRGSVQRFPKVQTPRRCLSARQIKPPQRRLQHEPATDRVKTCGVSRNPVICLRSMTHDTASGLRPPSSSSPSPSPSPWRLDAICGSSRQDASTLIRPGRAWRGGRIAARSVVNRNIALRHRRHRALRWSGRTLPAHGHPGDSRGRDQDIVRTAIVARAGDCMRSDPYGPQSCSKCLPTSRGQPHSLLLRCPRRLLVGLCAPLAGTKHRPSIVGL